MVKQKDRRLCEKQIKPYEKLPVHRHIPERLNKQSQILSRADFYLRVCVKHAPVPEDG